ncbi:MAG: NAD-dependent epimerase/dehydratase family protein [Myxococcota bacterium]|jgi:nucleoside-diphosphate-sugar epimerase|nr:NAD-dependent epimerase/dehydratase family protein [Myxococcota bacterium]
MTQAAAADAPRLRVMVTGGTGFVGFHTVKALVEAGHEVQLLVRSREKFKRIFEPTGLVGVDCVVGDITERGAVEAALDGCNAVVHSAALVSVHAEDSGRVLENNLQGTRFVLGGASDRGIERMIQVSSATALFRPGARRINETAPLGDARSGYGRSKIECDRYVRQLQSEGAPVYTTYPGAVLGPDDPGLSEGMLGLKLLIEGGMLIETSSGLQMIDVRDLALAHVRLLERGGPPDRYPMGGQYFAWPAYGDLLGEVLDRKLPRVPVPGAAVQWLGRAGDLINQFATLEAPLTAEATRYATEWIETDDRHIKQTLDFEYRDIKKTLYDAIFWLQGSGHAKSNYRLTPR